MQIYIYRVLQKRKKNDMQIIFAKYIYRMLQKKEKNDMQAKTMASCIYLGAVHSMKEV